MKPPTNPSHPTVTRGDAATWAGWFKALGDPTQILILDLFRTEAGPMTTGEVVESMDVGQSTVSHHLETTTSPRWDDGDDPHPRRSCR